MCGIVGIIDYTKTSDISILENMRDSLFSRGPNDAGLEFYENSFCQVGLGHRRLSILDLSSLGHQPMSYEHLTIVFNGEVYNFQAIKQELQFLGYEFISHSDTEVILKAFYHWGIECVSKFRGMFAFSIYDKKENKVYLFRDRVGVKPLYCFYKDDIFLFASELKALYQHPSFEKIIDTKAVSLFLQFGYIQAPYSIFKNTFKLEPAHYLEYDLSYKSFKIKQYWEVLDSYKKEKENSYENAKDELEKLLQESFALRTVSDVPIGTFLSGGVDSSLVTAILQHNMSNKLSTFTIGFEDKSYNEAGFAKNIANYLNTNHTEYYCSNQDAMNIIPTLPTIYDEPFGDSSAIPTILVSQIAKKSVSVILSGDGGDEVFCGYSSYSLFESRFKKIDVLPKAMIKKILNCIPDPLYALYNMNEKYYLKYLKFKNTLEHGDIANMYKVANSVFTKHEVESVLKNNYFYIKDDIVKDISHLERMMVSDFKGYLCDDILVKVDRASMSVSLEAREPLLDHKIIEYAARLPIEYKKDKRILKDILSNYIPRNLFERPKAGFGIPINDWLRKELKYLLDEYLNEEEIKRSNIFNEHYVQELKRLFLEGKNNDRKIWTLLMFQMWYKENMK